MSRQGDLLRITPDVRAVRGQHFTFTGKFFGRPAHEVPMLGVPGGDAQCSFLPAAADADRRMWLLWPLRLVTSILELVELAVEVRRLPAEQSGEHLTGLFESVETLLDTAQLDPVGAGLLLVPACADAEFQTPTGNDVQRRGHVGQHRRVPVMDTRHQHSDTQPLGGLCERCEGYPALQTRAGGIGEDRIEVVEGPAGFEDLDVVGHFPDGQHVVPGGVLRRCLECKAHCTTLCAPYLERRPGSSACRVDRPRHQWRPAWMTTPVQEVQP
ncbi:Uncharacterised protein [Mycobacteroides abscessus subsp. abscessus]|nr:Uncharacterised protein [Mycobacteroides abscessus subsp. abscessus]